MAISQQLVPKKPKSMDFAHQLPVAELFDRLQHFTPHVSRLLGTFSATQPNRHSLKLSTSTEKSGLTAATGATVETGGTECRFGASKRLVEDLIWIAESHFDGRPAWDDESRRVYAALDKVVALLKLPMTLPAAELGYGSRRQLPGQRLPPAR